MQTDLSPSKTPYRPYLYFLGICLLLMLGSCHCKNHPVRQKNKKDNGSKNKTEETDPTHGHLLLSSDQTSLEGKQPSFVLSIRNDKDIAANLHEYYLKISLQEEGGKGTILEYTPDTTHTLQPDLFSQQPLSQIFQQDTLQKGSAPLRIPFKLQPVPEVKKITITILLEHQHQKDQVPSLTIHWDHLTPITDAMIQLARDKGFPLLSDTLTKLQRREVVNLSQRDNEGLMPFHLAAKLGDLSIFDALLDRGADIEAKGIYGITPILLAAWYGQLDLTKRLIEKGAALDPETTYKRTPLIMATYSGHTEIAKMLIEKLPPHRLNQKDVFDQMPLYFAAKYNRKEIAEELLKKLDLTQVHESTKKDSAEENDNIDDKANTILVWAIKEGRTDLALAVIKNSDKLKLNNPRENVTPLVWAISTRNVTIALPLIKELGVAQLNQGNSVITRGGSIEVQGFTPLHMAASSGQIDIVRALLQKGVDKNITNKLGETPLALAKTQAMRDLLIA